MKIWQRSVYREAIVGRHCTSICFCPNEVPSPPSPQPLRFADPSPRRVPCSSLPLSLSIFSCAAERKSVCARESVSFSGPMFPLSTRRCEHQLAETSVSQWMSGGTKTNHPIDSVEVNYRCYHHRNYKNMTRLHEMSDRPLSRLIVTLLKM